MMSIPLGGSNFSSATHQLIQTVKMSEINQTRNATWVHMINDHVIDCHDVDGYHENYEKDENGNDD